MASSLAAESEGGSVGLETVTVTAQRREESLQSVPIAVSTISGADAELRGTTSIQTLSATIPNLTMTTSGFGTSTYIRGVGTVSSSYNNEPSAATYVDGVYIPSSFALSAYAFNYIERLEVLKGPQGTLFGRNTTAGVIQVVTPDPEHEVGGNVSLGYGNYDTINAKGYLTGEIASNLAADVAVLYEDQGSGYGRNLTYGGDIFVHDNVAARSKWLYTPSDATSIRLSVDYTKLRSDGINFQVAPGSVGADDVTTYPGRYNYVGIPQANASEQYGGALRIEQDLGSLRALSISSYQQVSGEFLIDDDSTATLQNSLRIANAADYFTQELQLSSRDPGRIEWVAGAFYYQNRVAASNPRLVFDTARTPLAVRRIWGTQRTESASLFGQATAELFADTKLTLGLRYTDEQLKLSGLQENLDIPTQTYASSAPFIDELSFEPWTWRVALAHEFTPALLGYISYNHGFKSGGYNLGNPATAPFDPETNDAYEVGLKSEFLDNRVRLNLSAFYYDYQDLQVQVVTGAGASTIFTNAAAARNYGVDIDLQFAATENLTLAMGLGLLDAKYENYPNAIGYTPLGQRVVIPNAKGRDLPFAPRVSGFVTVDYQLPTSIGEFKTTATASYNDKSSIVTPYPTPYRPSYTLVSASVEWRSPADESFGLRLWGRNLTDATYFNQMSASTDGYYQSQAAPRMYGLMALKEF